MIKQYYEDILEGKEVRQNLIEIKKCIKDAEEKKRLDVITKDSYSVFVELLNHEDPKVRKNASLILGMADQEELLEPLFKAYQKEEKLFVKESYLVAMESYSFHKYFTELKQRLEFLLMEPVTQENEKHVRQEVRKLQEMILTCEPPVTHLPKESGQAVEVILLTNQEHREVTGEQIIGQGLGMVKYLRSGVLVKTKQLKEVLKIRTYSEFLLPVTVPAQDPEPKKIAAAFGKSNAMKLILDCHEGVAPFYFRVEVRSNMTLEQRSAFTRQISADIEKVTGRKLINSTSNYEIEIRLIEKKDGKFLIMMKFYTWKDTRFSYRKEHVAVSIHPVNAALIMELIKPYVVEEAQVLDPFCGVGTMLIERDQLLSTRSMYGTDIFGEAILKARENAIEADKKLNVINRNYFDFTHDYLFDEIVTDLPVLRKTHPEEEGILFFESFFAKTRELLKKDGMLFLYGREKKILMPAMNSHYKLIKEIPIDRKENSFLWVIRCL